MTSPIAKVSTTYVLHRYAAPTAVQGRSPRAGAEIFQTVANEIQVLAIKLYQGPTPNGGGLRLSWNGHDAGWAYWPTSGGSLSAQVVTFAANVLAALQTIPALSGNLAAVGSFSTDAAGNVTATVTITFQAALADLAQPLISQTDGPITASGATVWSYWTRQQPGVPANTPQSILGSFQPLSPREVMLLPEGERANEKAKFYTEGTIKMLDQVAKTPADRIEARGRLWEVQNVTQENPDTGMPYFKAMLNLVEVD